MISDFICEEIARKRMLLRKKKLQADYVLINPHLAKLLKKEIGTWLNWETDGNGFVGKIHGVSVIESSAIDEFEVVYIERG